MDGVSLTDVSDGPFELVDFNTANGMVFGVSTSGDVQPAGSGVLLHLEFEAIDGGSTVSLSSITIGDNEFTLGFLKKECDWKVNRINFDMYFAIS